MDNEIPGFGNRKLITPKSMLEKPQGENMVGGILKMPLLVGSANNGSEVGVSVLNANNVPSNSNANYGGALTP